MQTSHLYCTACGAANETQDAFCFACGRPLRATTSLRQYPTASSASSTQTGLLTPNHLLKQRYQILSQLGKGGFGAVYKAEDTQFGNRLVAVKEMSQSGLGSQQEIDEAAKAFEREAFMLANLRHQNLPRIYDHFSDNGRWYLVMDFIEGETLQQHLNNANDGYLSVDETLHIGIQLCTVLDYLHTRQPPIIFRDLTPANIMLTPDAHVYLIDFGIARHFKPGKTKDTTAFGSPGYASPEQYGNAQTTPRSDIYSLGATLHYMLTGIDPSQKPFRFAPPQLSRHDIPSSLSTLVMQMLDMDESRRPASMTTIKHTLQQIAAQLARKTPLPTTQLVGRTPLPTTQLVGGTPLPFIRRALGRNRMLSIIAGIIVVILVFAFIISAVSSHAGQPSSQVALNNSSTTSASAPIATPSPTPTVAPTPTPTPLPPTPTPTPEPTPGDVLYQANSTWSGWNGTKDWKVNGGLLLNDGTYADYNAAPTIVAPYQSGSIADYAVEIQMQVVSAFTTGTIYPCFYIAIRGTELSDGWQGYVADVCANLGHGPEVQIVAVDSSNNIFDVLSSAPFDPQNAWHSYRVEAKGTTIKFFVDGGLLLSVDDSRYLNAGQIGLLSEYMQVKLSSFKIIAL